MLEQEKLKETLQQIKEDLDLDINYVARDSNGRLYGFTHKPFKAKFYWNMREGKSVELDSLKMNFVFITFEDKKPYTVEELLKEEDSD